MDERAGITHIAETHVHNDYVSGGLTLARVNGATYLHAADEALSFDHLGVRDGDRFKVGRLRVTVSATPDHTPHHLSDIVTVDDEARASVELNRAGGVAVDLPPAAPVDPVEVVRCIHRGEWVVDVRPRCDFAAGHVPGTIGIELDDGCSTSAS